ncbi:MAG: IPT/TIG domain-containing protein [Candidatus Sulfotelmatobacter sp.]
MAISPNAALVGNSGLALTVSGAYFSSASTIMWSGTALTTSYTNSTTLTAQVPATDFASAGTATVTVVTPAPGGGTSGGATFTIQTTANPAPSLTSVNPNTVPAGSSATTIAATGSNFISSSTVLWNGSALATSYINSTTLNAQVPAADLVTAKTATVTVMNPTPGGGTSGGVTFTIQAATNPVPALVSISPNAAATGSAAIAITATGSNFVSSSTVLWNGSALTTSYTNSTTLTAQVPATDLATAGIAAVTVSNPTPGGGTSGAVNFTVGGGLQVVNILASDLAWDPVNQVIYLSLPSTDGSNGNSVQILNPTTGTLGTAAFAGSEPNLLSVSATSQLLYVSQLGAPTVEVMTLPDLGSDITIQLGSDAFDGPFYAMDLQAAPNADGTVAVVRGAKNVSPVEEGGVVIYDSGTARTNVICGWIQNGCPNPNNYLMDSIQWKTDGSEMFAANNEETPSFDFYTLAVNASGFGTVTDYPGVVPGFFYHIHYDAPTGNVYDDDGVVVNPSNGTAIGTFAASGLMVPDGTLGAAFFLGQTQQELGTTSYTIESFNITTFAPVGSFTINNVTGAPTALIRWGTNGLAFTTIDSSQSPPTGGVYLLSGSFVSGAARRGASPAENVQRTWKQRDPLHAPQAATDEGASTK